MFMQGGCRIRNCNFFHHPVGMFPAPRGNIYSPVDRGGIVNEWGGSSSFVSPSSRGRRGGLNNGGSFSLKQQSTKTKEESEKIKKLEKELRVVKEEKKALQRRIDQLEKLVKSKEVKDTLPTAVIENNLSMVAKDFEEQFDKSWKESYEKQIKDLKAELETLYDKETPIFAKEKTPNAKKKSPIAKKKFKDVLKKFASGRKQDSAPRKSSVAKKKLAGALRKLISVEKNGPEQAKFQCNTCDSIFKTSGLLRLHMRYKHGLHMRYKHASVSVDKNEPEQAKIQCKTCDSIFHTSGLLRLHMRYKHSSVITSNEEAVKTITDQTKQK